MVLVRFFAILTKSAGSIPQDVKIHAAVEKCIAALHEDVAICFTQQRQHFQTDLDSHLLHLVAGW